MKTLATTVGIVLTAWLHSAQAAPQADGSAVPSPKMNTVLIICDDLGVGDLGCYYAKDNPTPSLDKLAESGLVHGSFYTSSPSCSPARASLLTGMDARTVNVDRVLMNSNKHALYRSPTGKGPGITLGNLFKNNGYKTGYIGKWHLGYGEDFDPLNYGFDYFFGHRGGKIDYFEYTDSTQKFKYDLWENRTTAKTQQYATHEFAHRSTEFIEEHADAPFFLYVSLNAPHWDNKGKVPAPKEYMASLGPNPATRDIYVGAMRAIDDCVKEIAETLNEHELMDNTVLVFTSDQGAWQKTGGLNGPLRGFKGQTAVFEGGLRIPYIMLWPGREDGLKAISKSANLMDVLPTLADGLNLPYEAGAYQGIDLFSPKTRTLYAYHGSKSVIHHKGWKYIDEKKQRYLFDLAHDPFEEKNLIDTKPEKAQELLRLLTKYEADLAPQTSAHDAE